MVSGERGGRPRVSDSLTTPIVQTSTYTFKDSEELIAYQVSESTHISVVHTGAAHESHSGRFGRKYPLYSG